jgi:hypothetical protein
MSVVVFIHDDASSLLGLLVVRIVTGDSTTVMHEVPQNRNPTNSSHIYPQMMLTSTTYRGLRGGLHRLPFKLVM